MRTTRETIELFESFFDEKKKNRAKDIYKIVTDTNEQIAYLRASVIGIFGQQLAEIQRIKSEGDYEAGRILVEKYAVKVDPELHKEVLDRINSY